MVFQNTQKGFPSLVFFALNRLPFNSFDATSNALLKISEIDRFGVRIVGRFDDDDDEYDDDDE